jgi:hypothetical protein
MTTIKSDANEQTDSTSDFVMTPMSGRHHDDEEYL